MVKYFLTGLFVLGMTGLYAQDDMDEIFDDGLTESKIAVGTDIITDASGTLNLFVNVKPIPAFRIQAGVGILPFGTHIDLMNLPRRDELPIRDTSLSKGFHYSLGAHLIKETAWPGFAYYYYFDYKHWGYQAWEGQFDVSKFKGCFGMGYSLQISGGISFDMNVGVYLGKEKVMATELFNSNSDIDFHSYYFSDAGDLRSTFFNGFDFGLGVTYNFSL